MWGMSEGGTIAVLTGIGGTISAAVAFVAKYVLTGKDSQIARLEAEVAAYRTKIDAMQDAQLKALQEQLVNERKAAETQDRVAKSLTGLTDALGKFAPKVPA